MSDPRLSEALELAARRDSADSRARAAALLEALVAEGVATPRARFLLASLYDDHAAGLPQAILHYRAGLEADPADSAARNNLAVALAATGEAEQALAELERVLAADPSYGLAAQNLAQLAIELEPPALSALLARVLGAARAEGLARLVAAIADAGRQDALEATYGAGHSLKNLVGLAGSQAVALARKLPAEPALHELVRTLEKVYADWAVFLRAARSEVQRGQSCDLNAIAAEVARSFAPGEQPALDLAAAAPLARGDPAALREAVLNLARNAREASPSGAVQISTAAEAAGPWVRVAVTDDGPGIAPGNLRRIFAPGFTTKPRGSGFGLSIADRIARSEGGHIEVESAPGRGARFSLVLPAAAATPPRLTPRLGTEEYTR